MSSSSASTSSLSTTTKHTHTPLSQSIINLQNKQQIPPSPSPHDVKQQNKNNNKSTLITRQYLMSSLIAGVGSGSLASVICAPLDLIRTRMQVMGSITASPAAGATTGAGTTSSILSPSSFHVIKALKDITAQDGFRGCFRGLGATLATVPFFWGIYFPLYEDIKWRITRYRNVDDINNNHQPSWVHMSSAVLAGSVADFFCNPMFVVRTRMQTEALHALEGRVSGSHSMGIADTVRSLYREGGVLVFWRGLTASLLGLSHVAVQFPVYERLKAEARSRNEGGSERPLDLLMASGLSKVIASSLTYPHEVVRSRMMDARAKRSLVATIRDLIRNEGVGSLYAGLPVTLMRVVPNCCITFVTYEMLLRWSRENIFTT